MNWGKPKSHCGQTVGKPIGFHGIAPGPPCQPLETNHLGVISNALNWGEPKSHCAKPVGTRLASTDSHQERIPKIETNLSPNEAPIKKRECVLRTTENKPSVYNSKRPGCGKRKRHWSACVFGTCCLHLCSARGVRINVRHMVSARKMCRRMPLAHAEKHPRDNYHWTRMPTHSPNHEMCKELQKEGNENKLPR